MIFFAYYYLFCNYIRYLLCSYSTIQIPASLISSRRPDTDLYKAWGLDEMSFSQSFSFSSSVSAERFNTASSWSTSLSAFGSESLVSESLSIYKLEHNFFYCPFNLNWFWSVQGNKLNHSKIFILKAESDYLYSVHADKNNISMVRDTYVHVPYIRSIGI